MSSPEGGPSPEEMGINPEEFRFPPEGDTAQTVEPEGKQSEDGPPAPEMTEEDLEAMEKMEHVVAVALKELHDFLQTERVIKERKSPGKERLGQLVDQSGIFATMEPAARRILVDTLHKDKEFRSAELPQFIEKGKDVLALWIHAKGLGLAADRHFEKRNVQ